MKVYGYLRSAEAAFQIFSAWHSQDGQTDTWAGVYLHWRDGFILVVGDKNPECAPFPYEDAILHWELDHGAWRRCTDSADLKGAGKLARPGWSYRGLSK